MGFSSTLPLLTVGLLVTLVLLPAALALVTRWWGTRFAWASLDGDTFACRLALALVPLGIAMWAAHLLLHFTSGVMTILPAGMRALRDVGVSVGEPDWSLAHVMGSAADGLVSVQILLLDLGLLATLYLGWRVARPSAGRLGPTLGALAPWATVASVLFVVGVWILFQPMEMRGMLMP